MAVTPQGEKHLRWCADRALEELDYGGPISVVAGVVSDFMKDTTTAQIDPIMVMLIVHEAADKGPDELEQAIMDFNV